MTSLLKAHFSDKSPNTRSRLGEYHISNEAAETEKSDFTYNKEDKQYSKTVMVLNARTKLIVKSEKDIARASEYFGTLIRTFKSLTKKIAAKIIEDTEADKKKTWQAIDIVENGPEELSRRMTPVSMKYINVKEGVDVAELVIKGLVKEKTLAVEVVDGVIKTYTVTDN